ncbi:S-layer homology domain-containing protein [Paenibacillus terrae]|uniref:S-layer homology domain-containing protein n=1 Tax=Paenibacillus terrae TaxID=159743 RepID=UPI0003184EE2|nr:S-layer homology domain-containing protein [Paenibacillus terrae]
MPGTVLRYDVSVLAAGTGYARQGTGWASEAIDTLYAMGTIKGTSGTSFIPEKNITSADFVLLLVRALGLGVEDGSNFADVSQGSYYYEALSIAKKSRIISGMDGNNSNPKEEISRQDMMVIVARALKSVNKLASSGSAEDLCNYADALKVDGLRQR